MRKSGFTLLIVLLGLLVSVTGCNLLGGPTSSVKGFYTAVDKGDYTKAKQYLSASIKSQLGGKLDLVLTSSHDEYQKKGGIKSVEAKEKERSGPNAKVNATVKFRNGQQHKDNPALVKEDGEWKLSARKS